MRHYISDLYKLLLKLNLPYIPKWRSVPFIPGLTYTANPSALHSAWFNKANHVTTGLKSQEITQQVGITRGGLMLVK